MRRFSRRAATDASVFDQYACASPHTIFVESGGDVASPREFAERLGEEMDKALVRIPKAPVDIETAAQIESFRVRYELIGDLWKSDGRGWPVLYDENSNAGLAAPCYSRVIFFIDRMGLDKHIPSFNFLYTMANLKSSIKDTRRIITRTARNRSIKSRLKTLQQNLSESVENKDYIYTKDS